MFSTGLVAAAGFAFSDTAGQWAVLTELTRNALIGGAVVAYALYYARRAQTGPSETISVETVWETFPKFVVGVFRAPDSRKSRGISEIVPASEAPVSRSLESSTGDQAPFDQHTRVGVFEPESLSALSDSIPLTSRVPYGLRYTDLESFWTAETTDDIL